MPIRNKHKKLLGSSARGKGRKIQTKITQLNMNNINALNIKTRQIQVHNINTISNHQLYNTRSILKIISKGVFHINT